MVDNTINFAADNDGKATSSKPQAKLWLNIVYKTAKGEVISLPYGIALDTMPEAKISGSPEWQLIQQRKNNLLSALKAELEAGLKPGEEKFLTGLEVVARKVNDKIDPNATAAEVKFDFGLNAAKQ